MYEDMLVTFHEKSDQVVATVWRRTFPDGRQRRQQVSVYELQLGPGPVHPRALLTALHAAMSEPPNHTVGR